MDTITAPERPFPRRTGPERDQVDSWLDFYRATLLTKCDGLDVDRLCARPVASSDLSLLGLVRHMTLVEQHWFDSVFAGLDVEWAYDTSVDGDADFHDLADTPLDEVVRRYEEACARSRVAATGHDLDEMAARPARGGDVDLRWIHLHMIEEYARHCGHADLLRELIDGTTGY